MAGEKAVCCTRKTVIRILQFIFGVCSCIFIFTATGLSSCEETLTGPGSSICYPEYSFDKFASTVFLGIVGIFTCLWSAAAIMLVFMYVFTGNLVCEKNGEAVEYAFDSLLGCMNLAAFIWAAVQLNTTTADINQGMTVLEMSPVADRTKFELAIASAFVTFGLFALGIAVTLRDWTNPRKAAATTNLSGAAFTNSSAAVSRAPLSGPDKTAEMGTRRDANNPNPTLGTRV